MGPKLLVFTLLLGNSLCSVANTEEVTNDAYFFGQSPPVYPSRRYLCFCLAWRPLTIEFIS